MSEFQKNFKKIQIKSTKVKISENKALELNNLRILQKNLVYVVGLSPSIAKPEILEKKEYFGQYGKIVRIVVNDNKAYNIGGKYIVSYSAYITYSSSREASIAILASDNIEINGIVIKSTFGSTKYCTYFLKNLQCFNKNCVFYHYLVDAKDIMNKDDNISDLKKINLAIKLSEFAIPETKEKLNYKKYQIVGNILPLANSIYNRSYSSVNKVEIKYKLLNENGSNSNLCLRSLLNKNKTIFKDNIISNNNLKNFVFDISQNNTLLTKEKEDCNISTRNSISTTNKSEENSVENRKFSDFNENYSKTNKKLIQPKERSRFTFKDEKIDEEVSVPLFITKLIVKHLSTRYFFRNINLLNNNFDLYLNILENNWSEYLDNISKKMD